MADFFDTFEPDEAMQLERLSRLIYELRENHKQILANYGVTDEIALLEQIYTGKIAEHPAYEHYLGARILSGTRETVRAVVAECLHEIARK